MVRILNSALLLLLSILPVEGQDIKVSSRLQISIPHDFNRPGGYDHREALFGIPPYGGSITQNVYYAQSDLCDPNVDTRKGVPSRATDESGAQMPWPSPYILMVDRGGCTFVTKVRNAQRSGAAGVIIADSSCLCSAGKACVSDEACEEREPIMADDGSGHDISIPSFLMFKQDADPIKEALAQDVMMQLSMTWSLPNPDDRVEYSLWTTPTELVSREFELQFKHAAVALGEDAYFSPHMYVYDGIKSNCMDADGQNQCYNLCTNNGRYCATDPDNDLDQGISGADVIVESLRRICIWETYGAKDGIGQQWWDYVNEFTYRCAEDGFFTDETCVKDAASHAHIDYKKIETCMKESGGTEGDNENKYLENELKAKDTTGVVILPAAYVNGVSIRGALEFQTVFRAVCSGFAAGTVPDVCKQCQLCPDQLTCAEKRTCGELDRANASVSQSTFTYSLAIVVGVFSILGLIQWKRSQYAVRHQVRGIIAEYMPLDEENEKSTALETEMT
jgi:hypothetical protein